MKRLSIIIAAIAILLAGCRADVRLLLNVAEDGSGELAVEVGVDDELDQLITQFFGPSDEVLPALDLGIDGERSTRIEEGLTFYTTTVTFEDTAEIAPAAAGNFTDFALEVTDAGASFEATLDITGELDPAQFPIDPSAIDEDTLATAVVLSLPGQPIDHNADQILEDGRLSWTVPLDESVYMFANTEYPTSPFPWWLVVLLLLSAGLALAVWLAAAWKDRQTGTERKAAPEPPPVDTPEPSPGPSPIETDDPFFDING